MRNLIFTGGMLPALDYFTDQFCATCKENGWNYTVADVTQPLSHQLFASWTSSGIPCLVVMFNNVGLGLRQGNKNYWEQYHVPVANILVDHPRAFYKYLDNPVNNSRFYCIDRNHVSFVHKFYPQADVAFLPHGGNREGIALPWKERPIDVLLVSSCQKNPDLYHVACLPDQGASFYRTVIPTLTGQDDVTCEAAIHTYLAQTNSENSVLEKQLNEQYGFACENYARRIFKKRLIRAFSDKNIHLEVYGDHWDDEGEIYSDTIRLHKRISAHDCNALMSQAKFSLNAMPWFRDGSHERVFNAMCNGAIPVTDESIFFREILRDGEHALFYDRKEPETAASRIGYFLSHPDEASEIAKNGQLFAERHGTWGLRLREIIKSFPDAS